MQLKHIKYDDFLIVCAVTFFTMFIFWWVLYWVNGIIGRKFFSKYFTPLDKYNQYEWKSRVVSTIHALIGVALSLYCLLWEGELTAEPQAIVWARRTSFGTALAAAVTCSYWAYDLMLLVKYWSFTHDWGMLIHHIAGITPFTAGIFLGQFMAYAPIIILAEISTPFVNNRWFLATFKMQSSIIYPLNGLGMWLAFLLCRILWLPFLIHHQFSNFFDYIYNYHPLVTVPMLFGTIAVYGLSVYWFVLITKGLIKAVRSMFNSSPNGANARKKEA